MAGELQTEEETHSNPQIESHWGRSQHCSLQNGNAEKNKKTKKNYDLGRTNTTMAFCEKGNLNVNVNACLVFENKRCPLNTRFKLYLSKDFLHEIWEVVTFKSYRKKPQRHTSKLNRTCDALFSAFDQECKHQGETTTQRLPACITTVLSKVNNFSPTLTEHIYISYT